MPTWTIPGDSLVTELREHAKEASSKAIYTSARTEEIEEMMAELMALSKAYGNEWLRSTYILNATRRFLLAHAKDRSVFARDGESDASFAERIRTPADVVTIPALIVLIQQIVDDAGIVGTVEMFNLRPNKARTLLYASESRSDGGVFKDMGSDVMRLTLTTPFTMIPILDQDKVTIAGSASNNGTFSIASLEGDALRYINASGADETLGGGTITMVKYDQNDNLYDTFHKSYFGRGYRMGDLDRPNTGIVILPFGCTAETVAAVEAMLETFGAFGPTFIVECRENP